MPNSIVLEKVKEEKCHSEMKLTALKTWSKWSMLIGKVYKPF